MRMQKLSQDMNGNTIFQNHKKKQRESLVNSIGSCILSREEEDICKKMVEKDCMLYVWETECMTFLHITCTFLSVLMAGIQTSVTQIPRAL